MAALRVLCSTRRHPFSYLIRLLNFSAWSHEAIIDGEDVIEALGSTGVRRIDLLAAVTHYTDYAIIEFDVPDVGAAMQFARDQIGKPYDWTAIAWQVFGRFAGLFGYRRNWQDDKSWYCFELVESVLNQGGLITERQDLVTMRAIDHWASPLGKIVEPPHNISSPAGRGRAENEE